MAEKRVFVAEDNMLVMMSLEGLIEDMGWTLVGPAKTLAEAEALAADCEVDVALLDVNLGAERSYPVAEALVSRGVPVLFVTGQDGAGDRPASLADAQVLMKPYSMDDLEARMVALAGA